MQSTTGESRTGFRIGLVLAVVAAAIGGGYFVMRAMAGRNIKADLASADPKRVLSALMAIKPGTLSSPEGAALSKLTIDSLKEMPVSDVLDMMRSEQLSDDQRAILEENMQEMMMTHMFSLVEEYMSAAEDQREALLDRQIDEFEKFRKGLKDYEESHKDDPEYQKYRDKQKKDRSWSKEDRKKWMEGFNPDRQARMFFYFNKMRERSTSRGIKGWEGDRD